MKNWVCWLKGLLAAVIGGAANSATLLIVDPVNFNLQSGIKNILTVCVTSAILSIALYLKQSPLPQNNEKGGK